MWVAEESAARGNQKTGEKNKQGWKECQKRSSEDGSKKKKARKVEEEEAKGAMGFVGMERPRKMRGQKKKVSVPRK